VVEPVDSEIAVLVEAGFTERLAVPEDPPYVVSPE
jgi:hypothetical protein